MSEREIKADINKLVYYKDENGLPNHLIISTYAPPHHVEFINAFSINNNEVREELRKDIKNAIEKAISTLQKKLNA